MDKLREQLLQACDRGIVPNLGSTHDSTPFDNDVGILTQIRSRMSSALRSIDIARENAAAAHSQVGAARSDFEVASSQSSLSESAVLAREKELAAEIDRVLSMKVFSLEAALVDAENALEVLEQQLCTARSTITALSAVDLAARAQEIVATLANICSRGMRVLQTDIEHPALDFVRVAPLNDRLGRVWSAGGMCAPLRLRDTACDAPLSPCVTPSGTLIVPHLSRTLIMHDRTGQRLSSPPIAPYVRLPNTLRAVAFDSEHFGAETLVIGGFGERAGAGAARLIALHARTGAVKWTATGPGCWDCAGLAVLPGVCVSAGHVSGVIAVRSLATGEQLCQIVAGRPAFIAADAARGVIYVSVFEGIIPSEQVYLVRAWALRRPDNAAGHFSLEPLGIIQAAGFAHAAMPLAFLPRRISSVSRSIPSCGDDCLEVDCLVVATMDSPLLRAVSVPRHDVLGESFLDGTLITGIAGDCIGSTLAVADSSSDSVFVIPWPLPPTEELGLMINPMYSCQNSECVSSDVDGDKSEEDPEYKHSRACGGVGGAGRASADQEAALADDACGDQAAGRVGPSLQTGYPLQLEDGAE